MMFLRQFFHVKYRCLLLNMFCILIMMTGCSGKDEAIVLIPSTEEKSGMAELEAAERKADTAEGDAAAQEIQPAEAEHKSVYVYVCGAVAEPGVVEVPEGSRAGDALELAGGMTPEADPFYVNLAEIVTDGQKLYFPTASEAEDMEAAVKAAEEGIVNINTASAEELCTLPGIGASRAADIVRYREKNGDFRSKEDIMKVSGIKQNAYDKLCDKITVQ